ncbi:MAG: hypothetical protein AAFR18_11740 [Cyanobacteria bacterium J06627_32]
MQRSKLSLLPTASLIALSTLSMFGLSAPPSAQAQTRTIQQRQVIEYQRPAQTTPRATTGPVQIQAPGTTSEVQCGPTTCTCDGIDDCDALFTSTLCAPGTATTTEDDHGQCTKQ